MTKRVDGAQEQACSDEEDKRERELRDNKRLAGAILAGGRGRGNAMQACLHVAARGAQRGKDADDSRGDQGERAETGDYAPVDVDGAGEGETAVDLAPE